MYLMLGLDLYSFLVEFTNQDLIFEANNGIAETEPHHL
jgi:hypothetical protein